MPAVVNIQARKQLSYPFPLRMISRYIDEKIHYDTYIDRVYEHQIFIYNEMLYHMNGNPVSTKPLDFNNGAILIMTTNGCIFMSHKERGKIHHSTFLAGMDVSYACMVEVTKGKIIEHAGWSGHYKPTSKDRSQFESRLKLDLLIKYDQNLCVVNIKTLSMKQSSLLSPPGHYQCAISREPLLDPVKLPCGHCFNVGPLKKWYSKHKYCPLDSKPFDMTKVKYREKMKIDEVSTVHSKNLISSQIRNKEFTTIISELQIGHTPPELLERQIINNLGYNLFFNKDMTIVDLVKLLINCNLWECPLSQTEAINKGQGISFYKQLS